jgi:hypothetical protein
MKFVTWRKGRLKRKGLIYEKNYFGHADFGGRVHRGSNIYRWIGIKIVDWMATEEGQETLI